MRCHPSRKVSPQSSFFEEHGIIVPRSITVQGLLMGYVQGMVVPSIGTDEAKRLEHIVDLQRCFVGKAVQNIESGERGKAVCLSVLPLSPTPEEDCLGIRVRYGNGCYGIEPASNIKIVEDGALPRPMPERAKRQLGSRLAKRFPPSS